MKLIIAIGYVIFAVGLFLLAGCSGDFGGSRGDGTQPVSGESDHTKQPEAQAQVEGSLRDEVIIGFPSIPAHFDPLQGFGGDGHGSGMRLIFSALVEIDADFNVVPDLAESYAISADALTYTFNLRQDARFTDGARVTAGDVVFTYETLKNTAGPVDLSNVANVRAAGDAVTITLSRPQSTFILTVASAGIVPEHAYNADFGLNPTGSGPFKLAQFDVDQQFILEANEGYYGQIPEIKRAIFVRMADSDIQLTAVRGGQVDITMTDAVLAAFNTVPGYSLLVADTVDNMGLVMPTVPDTGNVNRYGFTVGNSITYDINFRKAIAYGIDREAISRDALNGFATPAFSENDGMPWSNPESAIEFDLSYAISLLEDSGWVMGSDGVRVKGGVRASVALMYFAGNNTRQAVAMAAARQARENLGIELIVEGVASSDIAARMFSEPLILAWGSSNPMTSYYLFHSSRAGLDDWYNPQNYTSAVVDGYLERAAAARTIEEAVPYFRLAQWDGMTGTSMRGDCPYVFLINVSHLYWIRDGLDTGRRPIHAHGNSWPLVANLREWKWVS